MPWQPECIIAMPIVYGGKGNHTHYQIVSEEEEEEEDRLRSMSGAQVIWSDR